MEITFGEYIKQRRNELGYPLHKVAKQIDIDTSTLGKIEKDERSINIENLETLSSILQTDKKTLLNYHYSTKIANELKEYQPFKS